MFPFKIPYKMEGLCPKEQSHTAKLPLWVTNFERDQLNQEGTHVSRLPYRNPQF